MVAQTCSTESCGGCQSQHLTARELGILEQTARGHSNEQIARVLFLSKQTVAHRLSDAFRKLQANSRADAIAKAYVFGILDPAAWPPRLTGRRCLR